MSAIRPDLPVVQPVVSGASAQVRAAQAAFFRAALTEVAQTSTAIGNPSTSPTSPTSPTSTKADETARLPRPGALLDIRV